MVVLAATSGFGGVVDREQAVDTAAITIAQSTRFTGTIVLPDTRQRTYSIA